MDLIERALDENVVVEFVVDSMGFVEMMVVDRIVVVEIGFAKVLEVRGILETLIVFIES